MNEAVKNNNIVAIVNQVLSVVTPYTYDDDHASLALAKKLYVYITVLPICNDDTVLRFASLTLDGTLRRDGTFFFLFLSILSSRKNIAEVLFNLPAATARSVRVCSVVRFGVTVTYD